MNRLSILIGLLLCTLTGCVAGPAPYTESERMTFASYCARLVPDEEHAACLAEHREMRSSCYLICYGLTSCYDRCDDTWDGETCGERDQSCLEHDYRFDPGGQPDVELGLACRASIAARRGCGVDIEGDPCATFEHTERREATAVYQCLADLECDADGSICGTPVAPYELARHFCDLARPAGYECTAELTAWLDASDGWLRDDVAERMYDCAPAAGADRLRCLNAWLAAIAPPAP